MARRKKNKLEKFGELDQEFTSRSEGSFTPIGCGSEHWFFIFDRDRCLLVHRQHLLLFSDSQSAHLFCNQSVGFYLKDGYIANCSWAEICQRYGNRFQGVAVDWQVRKDYSFHRFN